MTISYLIIKKLRLRQSQTGSRIIQTDRQPSAVAQGLQMGDRAYGVDNRCPIEDRFGQLTYEYPQCMVTNTYSHWWIDYIWLNMMKTISFCCTLRLSIVSLTDLAFLMFTPMVQEKSLPYCKIRNALQMLSFPLPLPLQMSFLHKYIKDTKLRERVAKPVPLPIKYFSKVQTKKIFAAKNETMELRKTSIIMVLL